MPLFLIYLWKDIPTAYATNFYKFSATNTATTPEPFLFDPAVSVQSANVDGRYFSRYETSLRMYAVLGALILASVSSLAFQPNIAAEYDAFAALDEKDEDKE